MLAGTHKKFYRIQHPEMYSLDLKVQYKHKIKLPLDMVSKHVFLYLCLPDYMCLGKNLTPLIPVPIINISHFLLILLEPYVKFLKIYGITPIVNCSIFTVINVKNRIYINVSSYLQC